MRLEEELVPQSAAGVVVKQWFSNRGTGPNSGTEDQVKSRFGGGDNGTGLV